MLIRKNLFLKLWKELRWRKLAGLKRDVEKSLVDLVAEESDFLADPMPNLYFTRDPFASCGNGVIFE